MELSAIISMILGFIPPSVFVATLATIVFVYLSQIIATKIEEAIEAKNGKQVGFFDQKRIWLTVFWAIVFTAIIIIGGFITWQQSLLYLLVIMGLSGILYNGFLKNFIKV